MILQLLFVQTLFSCGLPLNKALLGYCSFLMLTIVRLIIAGIILIGISFFYYKNTVIYKGQGLLISKKIIFGSFLKYFLKYWGMQYITITHMAFLLNTTPFWTALLDYLLYNTKLNKKSLLGLVIGFSGSLFFILEPQTTEISFIFSLPACAILLAIIAHSYGSLCTKALITTYDYSPFLISGFGSLSAGCIALILGLITQHSFMISRPSEFISLITLLILINNVIAKSLHTHLLKQYNATLIAYSDYLYPIIVVIGNYCYNQTLPSTTHMYAFLTTLIGLILFENK